MLNDPLTIGIGMLGAFIMGALVQFSTKKNSYWSTADFLPLVFWILLGTFVAIAIEEVLKRILAVDSETFPRLTGLGLIISGCGIYWYRTRKAK